MLNIFKNSAVILALLTLIIFAEGCGKKKEQTNLKASGTYEINDHWYMTISGETMDGTLDYTMTILPVGENDTVSIGNINKSFDDVLAIYRNDSLFIPPQTLKSKSGKKYDIREYSGTIKDRKMDIQFGYDDNSYDRLTGLVLCNITGTNTRPLQTEEKK